MLVSLCDILHPRRSFIHTSLPSRHQRYSPCSSPVSLPDLVYSHVHLFNRSRCWACPTVFFSVPILQFLRFIENPASRDTKPPFHPALPPTRYRVYKLMTWRLLTPGLYPHIVLWGGTLHHSCPFNYPPLPFLIPHTESILSELHAHVPPRLMHAVKAAAPPVETRAWLDRRYQASRNEKGKRMMAHSDESEGPSGE